MSIQNTESIVLSGYNKSLNRFIIFVVIMTGILIYAGGLVTTIGAGLAVPDWPLSFGSLNPSGWWQKPMIREEHGHRLIGATVGFLTLIMVVLVLSTKQRKSLKILAVTALIMVVIQGVLGGLRVIEKNIGFAMIHACLAQVFFCTLVTLAWSTSAKWLNRSSLKPKRLDSTSLKLAIAVFLIVFIQLILGAVMRHSGAGLAIPTFPLVSGGVLPGTWNFQISIHYAHRIWALAVFVLVLIQFTRSIRWFRQIAYVSAGFTFLFVIVQVLLGAMIIWTGRAIIPTTLHVLTGAMVLVGSLSCVLWLWRGE